MTSYQTWPLNFIQKSCIVRIVMNSFAKASVNQAVKIRKYVGKANRWFGKSTCTRGWFNAIGKTTHFLFSPSQSKNFPQVRKKISSSQVNTSHQCFNSSRGTCCYGHFGHERAWSGYFKSMCPALIRTSMLMVKVHRIAGYPESQRRRRFEKTFLCLMINCLWS